MSISHKQSIINNIFSSSIFRKQFLFQKDPDLILIIVLFKNNFSKQFLDAWSLIEEGSETDHKIPPNPYKTFLKQRFLVKSKPPNGHQNPPTHYKTLLKHLFLVKSKSPNGHQIALQFGSKNCFVIPRIVLFRNNLFFKRNWIDF